MMYNGLTYFENLALVTQHDFFKVCYTIKGLLNSLYMTKLVWKFDLIFLAIEKFWKILKKQELSSLNSWEFMARQSVF